MEKTLVVNCIPNAAMSADAFTKPLPRPALKAGVAAIGIESM